MTELQRRTDAYIAAFQERIGPLTYEAEILVRMAYGEGLDEGLAEGRRRGVDEQVYRVADALRVPVAGQVVLH